MLEIEVKLYIETEQAARDVCRRLGLPWLEGTFERNRVYDFPDGHLARRGALVRIRERGAAGFLTYKEKSDRTVAQAKVRLEYDTAVSDPASAMHLLTGLGLAQVMSYERYRARHRVGETCLEIDHLPGGWFCEIEGSPEEIAALRGAAGLDRQTPLVWSYPEIFAGLCERWPWAGTDWTFELAERGVISLPPTGDVFWVSAAREP